MKDSIVQQAITHRHEIHQHPELTWQEVRTAEFVAKKLAEIPGIEVTEHVGKNGVVGLLKGGNRGPVVALRADMDALPIVEETGVEYASIYEGVMHACGHDGHMAILLGAARVLSDRVSELAGSVKFIFQPAEEGGAGADYMCKDGVLENPKVDMIFGLHGWPQLEAGKIGFRKGAIMAATAEVEIKVKGKGGHAGFPHLAVDPILIASKIVDGLQAVSSRLISPVEPVVLSITQFHGGSANNVIPPEVCLGGTLRTVSDESQKFCIKQIERIAESVAGAFHGEAEVNVTVGYPATVNDKKATEYLVEQGGKLFGPGVMLEQESPSMGGEDFSYYLQKIPGSYFFLGVDDGREGGYPSLHHPEFDFNDDVIGLGIDMFVGLALGAAGSITKP